MCAQHGALAAKIRWLGVPWHAADYAEGVAASAKDSLERNR
jgi:hypothetical protein